jgi:hypothetical protein
MSIFFTGFFVMSFNDFSMSDDRSTTRDTFHGPLRVSKDNPRYFTDNSGKAIYLTGSHTWNNFQDMGPTDPPQVFDFHGYLNFLQACNHNFIRLWTLELTKYYSPAEKSMVYVKPFPWPRTGPGKALDGKPKFDLSQLDQSYFDRLRARVIAAGEKGIYVSIMLFEGWGMQHSMVPWRWDGHPFNRNNNINNVDGDPNGDGLGLEIHTLNIPAITAIQGVYVKNIVDNLNDLDNVLYEIANESGPYSTNWQYHMIDLIKSYEENKPKQHPVGMTFQFSGGTNSSLYNSNADWISPGSDDSNSYAKDSIPADGQKVILLDTDHVFGMGGNRGWVWKSFLRGHNVLYMDNLDSDATRKGARKAMGHTLHYAKKIKLSGMTPQGDAASTGYVLANPGFEYLIYLPSRHYQRWYWFDKLGLQWLFGWVAKLFGWNETVTVELPESSGMFGVEWFNTRTGETTNGGTVTGGYKHFLISPFAGDAVLYIYKP